MAEPIQSGVSGQRWIGLLLALVAGGCATALPVPEQPGAADAYRAEQAKGPKGNRAREVREGLERAEWESARQAHTILGYRKFLSEFPAGPRTAEARARLEALRWADAEAAGTEAALAGFLADEPGGAHSAEAWQKLAQVRLASALASPSEPRLRAWLAAHPQAEGREQAIAALDDAQFAAAQAAEGEGQASALGAYLAERADGRHRAEAERLLARREVLRGQVLEDDARLLALARAPGGEAARTALATMRVARAEARMDREALEQLASEEPVAAEAARAALARLGEPSVELGQAARRLYLPQPASSELADEPVSRASGLWSWALALDGGRLHALLGELRAEKSSVALAALHAATFLLAGLPEAERRARAELLLEPLRARAQSAALLVQVSLLAEAAGRPAEALAQARAAVTREPALLAVWRAAELEARAGEPPLALLAVHALIAGARTQGQLHGGAVQPGGARAPDHLALLELCAGLQAAREAERLLGLEALAGEPGVVEARQRAAKASAGLAAQVSEAENARRDPQSSTCAGRSAQLEEEARAEVSRRAAAAAALAGQAPARAAIERARRRDPAEAVQRALGPVEPAAHAHAGPR